MLSDIVLIVDGCPRIGVLLFTSFIVYILNTNPTRDRGAVWTVTPSSLTPTPFPVPRHGKVLIKLYLSFSPVPHPSTQS
jgi:hypothetical protein